MIVPVTCPSFIKVICVLSGCTDLLWFSGFVFNISDSASDACCLPSDINTNGPAGSDTFMEGWRLQGQKERADGGDEIEVPSLVR